jgi:hypothetical protein
MDALQTLSTVMVGRAPPPLKAPDPTRDAGGGPVFSGRRREGGPRRRDPVTCRGCCAQPSRPGMRAQARRRSLTRSSSCASLWLSAPHTPDGPVLRSRTTPQDTCSTHNTIQAISTVPVHLASVLSSAVCCLLFGTKDGGFSLTQPRMTMMPVVEDEDALHPVSFCMLCKGT